MERETRDGLSPRERLARIGEVLLKGTYVYAALSDEETWPASQQHDRPEPTDDHATLQPAFDDSICIDRHDAQGRSRNGGPPCG